MILLEVKTYFLIDFISSSTRHDLVRSCPRKFENVMWLGVNFGKSQNHQLFKILSLCNTPNMNNLIRRQV